MKTRDNFLNYISAANDALASLELNNENLQALKQTIQNTELLIPVVGAFSAGKSTLINSFLGNDLLPTAITPETALATELRYSTEEYIEAISADDNAIRYQLDELQKIKDNAQKYKNLRIYLNNDNLKAIQPLILVDMPGFDAPIQAHNQAILNYLNKGVHFVFLTSVVDGNITATMKRELSNLTQFKKTFSMGLSKTNLKPAEDVEKVRDLVKQQLSEFDYTKNVILFNQNGGENLKSLLQNIDPEALFASLFSDLLKQNYLDILENIQLNISTLKADKAEADNAIKALKESIQALNKEKNNAIQEAESRYKDHSQTIINQVSSALIGQKDLLVNLALKNPTALSQEINSIAKDTLLTGVQKHFTELNTQIISGIGEQLKNVFSPLASTNALIGQIDLQRIQENTTLLLSKTQSGLDIFSKNLNNRAMEKNANAVIKTISTIAAVTTSVVNPVLELVIIFLPEIISFFTNKNRAEQARENAENQILFEVIPKIKQQLKSSIPDIFTEQTKSMIEQINAQIEVQLQEKQAEIEQAEKVRADKENDINNRITELDTVKATITQAANEYLF